VLGGLLAWSLAAHRRVERALEVAQRERG
jgi:hypothetical protein